MFNDVWTRPVNGSTKKKGVPFLNNPDVKNGFVSQCWRPEPESALKPSKKDPPSKGVLPLARKEARLRWAFPISKGNVQTSQEGRSLLAAECLEGVDKM